MREAARLSPASEHRSGLDPSPRRWGRAWLSFRSYLVIEPSFEPDSGVLQGAGPVVDFGWLPGMFCEEQQEMGRSKD